MLLQFRCFQLIFKTVTTNQGDPQIPILGIQMWVDVGLVEIKHRVNVTEKC